MSRVLGAVACLLVGASAAPAHVEAQGDEPLYLSVDPESGGPVIRFGNLFEDEGLTEALHSGLPLRIRVVVELWKDEFFDDPKGRSEWRASILYDPLDGRYRVATGEEGMVETAVDSLPEARTALQARFSMALRPLVEGRYYYLGRAEVETLSLSDLDELRRWLRGDLAPAVAGEEQVGGAVGRGMGRVFVRILGLPARRFKLRTPKFEFRDPVPR